MWKSSRTRREDQPSKRNGLNISRFKLFRRISYKGVVFTGGSFRKGVRVPIGGGVCFVLSRVQVVGGGLFPVENEGNGEVGGDKQRDRQVNARAFVKTTL